MSDSQLRLEMRKNVDYGKFRIAVFVLSRSSQMRVNQRRSVYIVYMKEHADTGIVTAEQKQQEDCKICSFMRHFYDLRGAKIEIISFYRKVLYDNTWIVTPTAMAMNMSLKAQCSVTNSAQ